MTKQLSHNEIVNTINQKEIIVITDNIRTPENVGMLFRVSEAFGVTKVILIGESPDLTNNRVKRTARSTEKELSISFNQNSTEVIQSLKKNSFHLIGLEITNTSTLLNKFNFSKQNKIALFIGNERNGINPEILNELDTILHFDLFGKNSSINVINALTIGLYEILR